MDRHIDMHTCGSEQLERKGKRKVEQSGKLGLHPRRFEAQSWLPLYQGISS